MSYQNTFKRYEMKYMLTAEQKKAVQKAMEPYMKLDEYGRTTICNIYFDTPDSLLIRRSLDKPVYKEKLRVRSYGRATQDSSVFIELKKKYKSVVYKRRISAGQTQAMKYLCEGKPLPTITQITEEIDYFLELYGNLKPAVYLSYEREAYYGLEDKELRVTFDENILWREEDLSLCSEIYGEPLLEKNSSLMEIKIAGAMPLWMAHLLSKNHIFQTSFSKYGSAYLEKLNEIQTNGGRKYA